MDYDDWDYDYLEYIDSEYGIYWDDYLDYPGDQYGEV